MKEKLKNQIQAYEERIKQLVKENGPDRQIGKLELRKQALIRKLKALVWKETYEEMI